jgi:hypothetical protein
MNKKILLFGSILSVLIMMMLPSISAYEFNESVKVTKFKINNNFIDDINKVLNLNLLNNLNLLKNYLKNDIWSILFDMINDIIGALTIFITFKGINTLFAILIPPFVSIPLVFMMKLIEFGVYGAILFDLIRNIILLIINIFSQPNVSS